MTVSTYSPLQQAVFDELSIPQGWTPLPGEVVTSIETMLVEALSPLEGWFSGDEPLRVNKHHIATVHGCEAHHMAQRAQEFSWNLNTVRGTVVHKAIELLLNWKTTPVPQDLVDAAFVSIIENPRESASDFLAQLSNTEHGELRSTVVNAVTDFMECFPPLQRTWRPVVEHSARYTLFDESIVLTSRTDLSIGLPGRKVLIDLKTGRITSTHRDDLRFYALIETLRSRQPPRRLASYSLDAARLDAEDVTEGVLGAAVRRASAGIIAIAELVTKKREAQVRPGNQCRWCPINSSCEQGAAFLRSLDEGDDDEY